jgi:tRNA(Ile)-lysidine synthase TilS/MesJ
MRRCTRCILPASFPEITFDADGVCRFCRDHEKGDRFMRARENLHRKLMKIIGNSRNNGLAYHALAAFSGGKDSTFLIHTLKRKYDLNVLALTFDNGFMSETAYENIRQVVNTLNVDHLIIKPARHLMRKTFAACVTSEPYPAHLTRFGSAICISCIRMVITACLRVAIEKKIPMVMMGNSPGQLIQSEHEMIFQDNIIPYAIRRALFKTLADHVGEPINYHLTLKPEEYKANPFPFIINLLPIIGYSEAEIYRTITRLGWQKPADVDPNSTNCRLNALGIIKHQEHYGFHPYDYELSSLVRLNMMTREDALKRVSDPEGKARKLARPIETELLAIANP